MHSIKMTILIFFMKTSETDFQIFLLNEHHLKIFSNLIVQITSEGFALIISKLEICFEHFIFPFQRIWLHYFLLRTLCQK